CLTVLRQLLSLLICVLPYTSYTEPVSPLTRKYPLFQAKYLQSRTNQGALTHNKFFLRFTIVAQTTLGFYLSFGKSLLNEDIKHKGSVFNAPRTPFNYGS